MPEAIPDYYAVLGVAPSASEEEIHHAYRRLARLLHPDLHPDQRGTPAGAPDIRIVNEAWEVLGDPESRAAYDHVARGDPPDGGSRGDGDEPYYGVHLPAVPPGFELHPRRGYMRAAQWMRHRSADALHAALSLAAQSADLTSLSRLGQDDLWFLDLMGVAVTDSDMRALSRFRRLEVLLLDDSAVTDAGLEWFERFPALNTLSLTGCHVTDAGLPALAKIGSLQNLELDQTLITDDGLAALAGHASLIVLDIRRTKVRGRGIAQLVDMPALRELRVSGWAELAAMKAFRGRHEVRIL